jgi:excisionase family DNA binding protein
MTIGSEIHLPKRLLSILEVAGILRVSPKTVYSWIGRKYLPGIKLGRLVKVDQDQLEKWLVARQQGNK